MLGQDKCFELHWLQWSLDDCPQEDYANLGAMLDELVEHNNFETEAERDRYAEGVVDALAAADPWGKRYMYWVANSREELITELTEFFEADGYEAE